MVTGGNWHQAVDLMLGWHSSSERLAADSIDPYDLRCGMGKVLGWIRSMNVGKKRRVLSFDQGIEWQRKFVRWLGENGAVSAVVSVNGNDVTVPESMSESVFHDITQYVASNYGPTLRGGPKRAKS